MTSRAPCSFLRPKRRMSPDRFCRWTGAGAWAGRRLDTLQRMCGAIEALPQLTDGGAGSRVTHVRRDIRERSEHVGPLKEIRPRQLQSCLIADHIAVQQNVEVHRTWRPLGRAGWTAAQRFDA